MANNNLRTASSGFVSRDPTRDILSLRCVCVRVSMLRSKPRDKQLWQFLHTLLALSASADHAQRSLQ